MKILKLFFLLIFLVSFKNSHSQDSIKYIDEFGKILNQNEFEKLKKDNAVYSFNNIYALSYGFYSGNISEKLSLEIKSFLSKNKKIPKNHILVINAAISSGNCNIQNMDSYNNYKYRIKLYDSVSYFEVKSEKSRRYKDQLVDNKKLIFDNFFPYYKWKIKKKTKCGGTLVIYPNNTFDRFIGDGNSFSLFDLLNKKASQN